jgi:hypothetical protein
LQRADLIRILDADRERSQARIGGFDFLDHHARRGRSLTLTGRGIFRVAATNVRAIPGRPTA